MTAGRDQAESDGRPLELALSGPDGEPVDLWRTLVSHGLAFLPPSAPDETARTLDVTLAGPEGPRTVRLAGASRNGRPVARVLPLDGGPDWTVAERDHFAAVLRRMLCLDDRLSEFYQRAAADPALAWVTSGAGRLLRSPTVFEDLVKILCTTNCSWSATVRMTEALVRELGGRAPGAAADGGAFPTAAAMAGADDVFYREVVRAGYRGPRLRAIAVAVAAGELDLEGLLAGTPDELPDDEVERRLLALPGVGSYTAAHVMLLLGRPRRLVLDSWTRPKYARLQGKPPGRLVADRTIERRFRRYGRYAGLAFWLTVTGDWVDQQEGASASTRTPSPERSP